MKPSPSTLSLVKLLWKEISCKLLSSAQILGRSPTSQLQQKSDSYSLGFCRFLGPWGRNRNTKQMPTCRWCHQCRRCLQSTHSPSQRVILFWNLRRMNQHSPINIHLYLPSLSFKERILCVFWRETRAMFLAFWPNFAPISPPSSPLQHSTWQCHHPSNPPQQCRSISVDVDAQPPPHLVSGVKNIARKQRKWPTLHRRTSFFQNHIEIIGLR